MNRKRATLAAALVAAVLVGLSFCGLLISGPQGKAAADVSGPGGPRVRRTDASASCSSNWTGGWTSVDLVLINGTNSTMTLDDSLSGPGGGKVHSNAPATLPPGGCAVVNASAGFQSDIFYLNVTYTLPNGDYVPFMGTANTTSLTFNQVVFAQQPSFQNKGCGFACQDIGWNGTADTAHHILNNSDKGVVHAHYTLTAY